MSTQTGTGDTSGAPSSGAGDHGPTTPATEPKEPTVPTAFAAAIAVVVAALAAVGVEGDFLTRAVRNFPGLMALLYIAAMTAVGLPAALWLYKHGRRTFAVGSALLVVIASFGVLIGARSVSDREQPSVTLSSSEQDGVVTITVVANATSLRTIDTMLVRVLALTAAGSEQFDRPCQIPDQGASVPPEIGRVVAWQQSGPTDNAGKVEVTLTAQLDAGYTAVCAMAVLADHDRQDPGDDRRVLAYLALRNRD